MLSLGLALNANALLSSGTVPPVTLTTVNGTSKHANIVLSNGNLTELGSAGDGNYQGVRATASKSGKRQFQIAVDTLVAATGHFIGVDTGATDLSADLVTPGASVTSGCTLAINGSGTYTIHKNGVNTGGGALTTAAGDFLVCVPDTVGQTVAFYQVHSGVSTQIDITQTGLTQTAWFPIIGGQTNAQNTAKFATGQARALDSGFVVFDS